MLVSPLDPFGDDTAIGRLFMQVGLLLVEAIGRLKVATVEGRSVADHDLGGVFVGHDDGGLGELRAHSVRVVAHQRLLGHAHVVVRLQTIRLPLAQKKWGENGRYRIGSSDIINQAVSKSGWKSGMEWSGLDE